MGNRRQTKTGLIATAMVVISTMQGFAGECRENLAALRGDWGQAQFTIEVADTNAERSKGLMNRESMPKSAGMLFVYPRPKTAGFWMKNTLIPLDMIFMDRTGTVQHIHHRAQPGDLQPKFGGDNIQYVLEINGGLAEQMGMAPGTQLRHPAIPEDRAAWAC
jgi:uncharacterized membrane protein (UPF0127 family)